MINIIYVGFIKWKKINEPGLKPIYEVSNFGEFRNIKTKKLIAVNHKRTGYCHISLYTDDGRKTFSVHRLVAKYFCDGYCKTLQVNHIDGIKSNNCYMNLEWVSPSENTRHAYSENLITIPRGSKRAFSIFTEEYVMAICQMLQEGKSNVDIMSMLNIKISRYSNTYIQHYRLLYNLRNRKKWSHITCNYIY